jgi:transcriptional regulator with XRE-family HTH domain
MSITSTQDAGAPVGHLIRHWRQQRRWSQLDLACEAEVSTRHLSFVETGRAQPSREMLLRLADPLELPLRERNVLLVAAGYAPVFRERALADPELAQARAAVERLLAASAPNPALAVDRHWNLVTANAPARQLMSDIGVELLRPPLNVLRASLHPHGLAPRIVNFAEWRAHVLHRLRRQVEASGDGSLAELLDELTRLPAPPGAMSGAPAVALATGVVLPLQLRSPVGTLSFLSTTMVFGTAVDITLAELVIESFFPADAATAAALARLAADAP